MQPCQVRAAVVGLQNGLVQTVTVQEISLLARWPGTFYLSSATQTHIGYLPSLPIISNFMLEPCTKCIVTIPSGELTSQLANWCDVSSQHRQLGACKQQCCVFRSVCEYQSFWLKSTGLLERFTKCDKLLVFTASLSFLSSGPFTICCM